jgi:hypothetical protein
MYYFMYANMEYGYCQEENEAVKERGTIGITVNKGGR